MGGSRAEASQAARHQRSNGDAAPAVSIVIPCYNQAAFLPEAIQSALAQSHPSVEIIVVDDGSADDTAAVAAGFPTVRTVRRPNGGLSAARNTGLAASRGRFLVFLDADDRLLPSAIADGLACLQADPEASFAYGHFRYLRADGSPLPDPTRPDVGSDVYAAFLERNFIAMHATVLYRREVFDRFGGFDPTLRACEDYDLYLRIARRSPIARHERLVAEYRLHSASMSHNAARMLRSSVDVLRRQWTFVQGNPNLEAAYHRGMQFWRDYYGEKLVQQLVASARAADDWTGLRRDLETLLRYDRSGMSRIGGRVARKGRKRARRWR